MSTSAMELQKKLSMHLQKLVGSRLPREPLHSILRIIKTIPLQKLVSNLKSPLFWKPNSNETLQWEIDAAILAGFVTAAKAKFLLNCKNTKLYNLRQEGKLTYRQITEDKTKTDFTKFIEACQKLVSQ